MIVLKLNHEYLARVIGHHELADAAGLAAQSPDYASYIKILAEQ